MASINRLTPGQIVYSIERQKMGNTTVSYGALFSVRIVEVHEDHVVASWNHNTPRRFDMRSVKKWRVNKPEPKRTIFGTSSYL